jgi:hypothetical protein
VPTVLGEVMENGRMLLDLAIGHGAIDPNTGNPSTTYKTLEVCCLVKLRSAARGSVDRPQPRNNNQLWCEGEVTRVFDIANPSVELDPKIPEEAPTTGIAIKISGLEGKLYLEPSVVEAEVEEFELEDIVGEPIRGWFEPQRRW